MEKINSLSIVGTAFSCIVAFVLPIVLIVVIKKKHNAKFISLMAGLATFIIFAMLLESILHGIVLKAFPNIQSNIWMYALYGAAAAAIFEECGRFIIYKFFMKDRMTVGDSLMMGIGHGGIEALIITMSLLSNLVLLISYNNGSLQNSLNGLDETSLETITTTIYALANTNPYMFFLAGIERASALFLQVALSVLVFYSFKDKKYFFMALAIHFFVDFFSVICNNYVNAISTELALIVIVVVVCVFAYKIHNTESKASF